MAKTFEEANREVGEKRETAKDRLDVDVDTGVGDLRDREFEGIFQSFGDQIDEIADERDEVRRDFDSNITVSIEEQLGVDFDELLARVGEINDLDLSELNQQQLLALIAEEINSAVVQLAKLSNQQSGLAALLDDIASSVQPPFGISVSGVNDIDDPNVAQPVVRGSDGGGVEARVFKLKASSENTSSIWLGGEDVAVGTGIELKPGEPLPLQLDLRQDQMFMVSEEDAQEIEIIGLV